MEKKQKEAERAADDRAKKLAAMAVDPSKALRETEELIKGKNSRVYVQIAELLTDLREALYASGRSGLAEEQARKLKENNPTSRGLTAEFKRLGFLKK